MQAWLFSFVLVFQALFYVVLYQCSRLSSMLFCTSVPGSLLCCFVLVFQALFYVVLYQCSRLSSVLFCTSVSGSLLCCFVLVFQALFYVVLFQSSRLSSMLFCTSVPGSLQCCEIYLYLKQYIFPTKRKSACFIMSTRWQLCTLKCVWFFYMLQNISLIKLYTSLQNAEMFVLSFNY